MHLCQTNQRCASKAFQPPRHAHPVEGKVVGNPATAGDEQARPVVLRDGTHGKVWVHSASQHATADARWLGPRTAVMLPMNSKKSAPPSPQPTLNITKCSRHERRPVSCVCNGLPAAGRSLGKWHVNWQLGAFQCRQAVLLVCAPLLRDILKIGL